VEEGGGGGVEPSCLVAEDDHVGVPARTGRGGGGVGGAERWGAVARRQGVVRAAAASGQRGRAGDGRLYPPRRTSSRSGRTACRRTWARASTPCRPGTSALGARGGRAACGELRGQADRCAGSSAAGPRRCTPRGRRGGALRAAETPSQREQRRPTSPRYPPPRWRTSRPSSGTRAYRRHCAPQGRAVQPARTPASWAPGSAVRLAASAREAVRRRTSYFQPPKGQRGVVTRATSGHLGGSGQSGMARLVPHWPGPRAEPAGGAVRTL
jgi:hypothetical protein